MGIKAKDMSMKMLTVIGAICDSRTDEIFTAKDYKIEEFINVITSQEGLNYYDLKRYLDDLVGNGELGFIEWDEIVDIKLRRLVNDVDDIKLDEYINDKIEEINNIKEEYKEEWVKYLPNNRFNNFLKDSELGDYLVILYYTNLLNKTEEFKYSKNYYLGEILKDEVNMTINNNSLQGIKESMIYDAGFKSMEDFEGLSIEEIKEHIKREAIKGVNEGYVKEPNLRNNRFHYYLTRNGMWTTSNKVDIKDVILVVNRGCMFTRDLEGDKFKDGSGTSIEGYLTKLFYKYVLDYANKKYVEAIFDTEKKLEDIVKVYEITDNDIKKYQRRMREYLSKLMWDKLIKERVLGLPFTGKLIKNDNFSKEEITDIINQPVELDSGLITRLYSIVEVEEGILYIGENARELREDEEYKELLIKEDVLNQEGVVDWYLTLINVNTKLNKIKELDKYKKELQHKEKVKDKAIEYLKEYEDIYENHKDKLFINKTRDKLNKVLEDSQEELLLLENNFEEIRLRLKNDKLSIELDNEEVELED